MTEPQLDLLAWKPRGELAGRTASVRVLQVTVVDGAERRSVVSHFNKATKGRLVRALLTSGARPRTPAALAGALRDLGFTVEEAGGRMSDFRGGLFDIYGAETVASNKNVHDAIVRVLRMPGGIPRVHRPPVRRG